MAMLGRGIEVVVEIMYMHVTVAETSAWCNMKIANDFVHPEPAFYSATLFALLIQLFRVMLSLTLFDVFSAPEGP